MPFRDRLRSARHSAKKFLGVSSDRPSSTSLPVSLSSSPSPTPRTSRHAGTPLLQAPDAPRIERPSFTAGALVPSTASLIPSSTQTGTTPASATVPSGQPPALSPSTSAPIDTDVIVGVNTQRHIKDFAWSGLKTLLKVTESTADVFPPLKGAIGGLNKCIEIFENASKGQKEYQDLQRELDSLLGDLSEHIGDVTSANITMSMENLCTGLNNEVMRVQGKNARNKANVLAEALEEPGEIIECYRRIQWYLGRFTLNTNLSIIKGVGGLTQAFDELTQKVDKLAFVALMDRQDAHLKQLPSAASAVYNSAQSEEIQRRACTDGTRREELKKLLEWTHDQHGKEVYWINGMAGTGKTTIAYSLCAELKKSRELGASFFCSQQIPESRDVKLIIPSIASQLAIFSRPFRFALCKVLEADPSVHSQLLKSQFENLLIKPLLEVKQTLPAHCLVVIDALDECDNKESVARILELLLLQTSNGDLPIRFLVSSRPEPDIYHQMMTRVENDPTSRLVLHNLDASVVRGDITTYIQDELKGSGLADTQLETLVEQCGVLFIYASTAARYIKDGIRFQQQQDRLDMILGLASPGEKYQGINPLYDKILQVAFDNPSLDKYGRQHMKLLLDTIICIQEPMTVDDLAKLLQLKNGKQVEELLRPLSSVLNLIESDRPVTMLHASFPDYMRDKTRSDKYYCVFPGIHGQLARKCFESIGRSQPMIDICGIPASHLCDSEIDGLGARVDAAISSWLFYACQHWMTHVELSESPDEMGALVHEFLSANLLLWMEVLNLKKRMSLGSRMIQRTEDWSKACSRPEETIKLAHDAWRFVTMFTSHAVSQSTPHIYVSMLPFWPESAPVSRHYAKHRHGAIRAHGSAMTRRQLSLLATWTFAGEIRSVCLSPDGTLIAYAMAESVHVIDGTTGRAILGPLEHTGEVNSVAFSLDGTLLASGADDKTVKVWKTIDGQPAVEPLSEHNALVSSVTFSPDGKRIISGSLDGTVRVWSLERGRMVVGPLQSQNGSVWSVGVSSDGKQIASGYGDGTIHLWDAGSGEIILIPLKKHSDRVNSLSFSPDSTRLASGSSDTTILIWSDPTGHMPVDVLEGHTRPVTSIAFSPDGKQLVSGSDDDTVRLWDVQGTPQLARVFTGHTNTVFCVRFSSDGARIVSSSFDRTIRVWDARSQGPADSPLEGHTQAVTSVAFSHGGSRIVSGSNDGTIYVWDGQSGEVAVGPMKGHSEWVSSVCVSPDGSRIASGSQDKTIQLWDAYAGQAVGEPLTGHSGEVRSVCFSPDGALLASSSNDKTIRLWNAESGEPVGSPFEAHTNYVLSVCFSPDNLRLVSGSSDKTILIWDVNTGKPILPPLKGHTEPVWAVCMSPDGTRITSGSLDTTVGLWDANDGQSVIGPLLGHTGIVRSVCFSPNGSYVISGSDDKTIRLWDAWSGQAAGSPLVGHTELVPSVAFSPDGVQIVSGSADLSIRLWDIADLVKPQEPKDDINKDREPSRAHLSWVLQDDGWVVDSQSRLLAWVPPDLHASLMSPRNSLLISTKGAVRLDFESAKVGESWAECYEPGVDTED